jgi:hypothetical protein
MVRFSLTKGKWLQNLSAVKIRKRTIVLSCLLILMILASWGLWTYSETPSFCGLCHNMEIYVNSWKTSSHRDVACIKCHYEPGFGPHLRAKLRDIQLGLAYIITGRGIKKPHHEVSDVSCLRKGCHAKADIRENMIFKNVVFNHSRHLGELRRGKRLRCNTCHDQIVQGAHLKVTEVDCFICHFYNAGPQGRDQCLSCWKCGSCHIQPKGDILVRGSSFNHKRYIDRGVDCLDCHTGINKGDGHVPENKCLECHKEHELRNVTFTSEFLHQGHVTNRKIECYRCHTAIKHEVGEPPTVTGFMSSCNKCHTGEIHLGPREMYMGTGGIGGGDNPNKMFVLGVDCTGCHKSREESKVALYTTRYTEKALANSCVSCHGEGYDEMLFNWKDLLIRAENDVNRRIFDVQKKLYETIKAQRSTDHQRIRRAQNLINEARHNFSFVNLGKGVHNIEYALRLLNYARNNAEKAMALTEEGYRPIEHQTDFTCTGLCHVGLEKRLVRFNEILFHHGNHMKMGLQCLDCHSAREDHGNTNLANCAGCHHGPGAGEVTCGDCHLDVKRLFFGKTGIGVEDLPSLKADVVECMDCHRNVVEGIKESLASIKANCIQCHDESYGDIAERWKSTADAFIKNIEPRLEKIRKEIQKLDRMGKHTFAFTKSFGDADYNFTLVKRGKGAHNVEYAGELMETVTMRLKELEATLAKER